MVATNAAPVDNLAQLSEVDARSRQLARSFIREICA
jgi:1-deoxy-D-xylulose-5-phosphate reductoisomerase